MRPAAAAVTASATSAGKLPCRRERAGRPCPFRVPALQNEVQSALPKIVTAGFKAVRLIYYFTAGVQEVGGHPAGRSCGSMARFPFHWPVSPACSALWRPSSSHHPTSPYHHHHHPAHARDPTAQPPPLQVRCWQIREHTKAPQAAGAIHSDFERGFICAEVMSFDDMKQHGSEAGAFSWRMLSWRAGQSLRRCCCYALRHIAAPRRAVLLPCNAPPCGCRQQQGCVARCLRCALCLPPVRVWLPGGISRPVLAANRCQQASLATTTCWRFRMGLPLNPPPPSHPHTHSPLHPPPPPHKHICICYPSAAPALQPSRRRASGGKRARCTRCRTATSSTGEAVQPCAPHGPRPPRLSRL